MGAKEDSVGTYVVLVLAIVLLFLFYTLLLLINNQSVLLPPEDEFDEYVANFLPSSSGRSEDSLPGSCQWRQPAAQESFYVGSPLVGVHTLVGAHRLMMLPLMWRTGLVSQ